MIEERINELAIGLFESMPTFIRHNREWQPLLLEKFQKTIRLAIKESSEEKDEVIRRLSLATDSEVGSCDCLTKSPEIQHHKKGCKYRLIVERNEAREAVRRLAEGTPFRGLEADKVVDVMNVTKSKVS